MVYQNGMSVLSDNASAMATAPRVVTIGDTQTLIAIVENVGEISLEVLSITFGADTSTEFRLPVEFPAFQLGPAGIVEIEIAYTPVDEGVDLGSLVVLSDDPDTPLASIPLSGTGVPPSGSPEIEVGAEAMRFGARFVGIGDFEDRVIGVSNLGNGGLDLRVVFGEGTSHSFTFRSAPTELLLAPGATLFVRVRFNPLVSGLSTGTLVFESNDQDEPRVIVPISGS